MCHLVWVLESSVQRTDSGSQGRSPWIEDCICRLISLVRVGAVRCTGAPGMRSMRCSMPRSGMSERQLLWKGIIKFLKIDIKDGWIVDKLLVLSTSLLYITKLRGDGVSLTYLISHLVASKTTHGKLFLFSPIFGLWHLLTWRWFSRSPLIPLDSFSCCALANDLASSTMI